MFNLFVFELFIVSFEFGWNPNKITESKERVYQIIQLVIIANTKRQFVFFKRSFISPLPNRYLE